MKRQMVWILTILWMIPVVGYAQIPTALTDKVYKGEGVIDLLKDVSGTELQQYIEENGGLLLGVDLNENNSGNESSESIGVAIAQVELLISTTEGDFTFSDWYTNTTALIQEEGSDTAEEFYTLFGTTGSSQITSSTAGFDLSAFDDVLQIDSSGISGDITSARVSISFLQTASSPVEGNETFFDFSGGFEDFALLSQTDADTLESAEIGQADAPATITYEKTPATPGAPEPSLFLLVAAGAVVLLRSRSHGKR